MAGDAIDPTWPSSRFIFSVDVADVAANLPFQEMTVPDADGGSAGYEPGRGPSHARTAIPIGARTASVTLKRGIVPRHAKFFNVEQNAGPVATSTVTIRLLDDRGATVMTWTLKGAYVVAIRGGELGLKEDNAVVESVELSFEPPMVVTK
jgi:phage tail-like protein